MKRGRFFLFSMFFSLLLSGSAWASDEQPQLATEHPDIEVLPFTSRDLRVLQPFNVGLQLSTLSLLVPFKPGFTASWSKSPEWTFEASLLSGSLSAGVAGYDVASYKETSYQLLARYYGDNKNFNWVFGFSQEGGRFLIGNKYVSYATGVGRIDLAELQSWAVVVGFGQRWQWKNGMTLGIEWAQISVPFKVDKTDSDFFASTATNEDKGRVRDILNILARVPRLSLAQLSVGYSF